MLPPDLYRDVISDALGQRVSSCRIVKLRLKPSGVLNSFVIKARARSGNFYLRRNVDHPMKRVFHNHQILHRSLPAKSIPAPVAYLATIDAILSREMPGRVLTNYTDKHIRKVMISAGHWLKKLHSLPPKVIRQIQGRSGTMKEILSSSNKGTLPYIRRINPAFYRRLVGPLKQLHRTEKKIIGRSGRHVIFGDFHPENIMNNNGRVAVVDFDDVTIGSPWRDVGTFVEQLRSILVLQGIASSAEVRTYQEIFLTSYDSHLTTSTPEIVFYQAWVAWRNALYFASIQRPNFKKAEAALQRCQGFLKQSAI